MDGLNNINETLLLNYFSGKLTALQRKEVEEWIMQSDENKKLARDIYHIYHATDTLAYMQQVNSVAELKKVKSKIRKRRNISAGLMWGQRIAAVLTLPLLAITLYLLLKPTPMEYVEIKTSPGMIASASLPDGSKVWLNSGSSIKHPVKFTGDIRQVELNGEAYFSVHKDRSKRFIVNTPFHIQTEVLGTEFNIEAYSTDSVVRTTLVSGSVKLVYLAKDDQEQSFLLKPDEEFDYYPGTQEVQVNKPYIKTCTAWKDGLVIFRNTSLEEALKILGKRFNVEFTIKNPELYKYSFTGVFRGQHLPLILEHFHLASGIQYEFISPYIDNGHEIQEKTRVELF